MHAPFVVCFDKVSLCPETWYIEPVWPSNLQRHDCLCSLSVGIKTESQTDPAYVSLLKWSLPMVLVALMVAVGRAVAFQLP